MPKKSPISKPLNILIVEDSQDDTDLILAELRRAGFEPKWKRVQTEQAFLVELKNSPDIVLSDYSMPGFSGLRAAELVKESGLNIPFILISGTVGEDVAVEAMKHGATDYLLKDRIVRLGAAVERALIEKRLRNEHQQVETSLNLFRALLDRSNDGIEVIDPQTGRFLDINTTTCQRLGYTREELLSMTVPDITDAGLTSALWAENVERIRQSGFRIVESRHKRKDGSTFPVEINVCYVKLDRDYLIAAVRDITERKQADEKLRQSEADLAEGQQVAKLGSWRLDIASNKVRWSAEVYRIFGVEPTEFHDGYNEFLNCVLPDDRPQVLKTNADARASGSSFEMEYRIQTRAGDLKTIREIGHATKDAGGKVVGLFGTAQDITELKKAEEELRWKTAFLEAQVDCSIDGILVVDSQGRTILQNQRMNELWKIPPQVAATKDDAVMVEFVANQTNNPSQFKSRIAHLYSHPDEVSRDEIELVHGTILERYSSPVRDKAGKYFGRIWTFRDITEQCKLEQQLRQAQKMEAFGQLAGGVAHDFNNILAVIQLQAGLLKTGRNLSLEELNYAEDIGKAAERGANLTRQLLLFSRKQSLQPRNLKLKEVVANITRMLERTLGEQVQLQFKFSEEPLHIYADPGMIDQILLNLAVNARDAMPKGGKIIIETSAAEFDEASAKQTSQAQAGRFVCLSVTDSGCGIPPEVLPRIFEPFFTTKEVGKGTGLGLATVFGIVQQHKGWINVYSEVGRGTTFRIYLPRLARTPDTKFLRRRRLIRGGTETILLVEDESTLCASVASTLSRLGYRVLEASSGNEALELWKQHRDKIQLLLTDLVMPGGMTGRELAAQLLEQNPKLKVVYSSGYSAEIVGKDFSPNENVNFLTKPYEAEKLAQTIRNSLDDSMPAT